MALGEKQQPLAAGRTAHARLTMAARRQTLPGARWHFQHGPMDIVIGAEGEQAALVAAHEAAWLRFQTLLDELVAELPKLRSAVSSSANPMSGVVARRMWAACWPHSQHFITPMAAVAGAVADELIACYRHAGIRRAWVNSNVTLSITQMLF